MKQRADRFLTTNALVLLSLVFGLAGNVLIASMFGLTRRVDAFFAAMMLPALFMNLFVDYLGKNFLPALSRARSESDRSASQLTSTLVCFVFAAAVVVTVAFVVLSRPIFAALLPGFDDADELLVTRFFWIMAPAIALMAVTTLHEYVCQYDERYNSIVRIRMGLPLTNLSAIALLGPLIGEYCLPIGYLAGHVVVFAFMARAARYDFAPRFVIRPHLEKKVFTNSSLIMGTGLVARSRSLIMNYFASMLGGGAITAVELAIKLTEPLRRSAFYAARMLMFSRTVKQFAERRLDELARLYEFGLRVSVLLLAPLLWWIGLNAWPIVDILYGHGAFGEDMVSLVAGILAALAPLVFFAGFGQLLSNAFYAIDRIAVPAITMPAGTLLFAALAWPLSAELGTAGLAVAMTLVAAVQFVVLLALLQRHVPSLRPVPSLAAATAYACLAGGTMLAAELLLAPLGDDTGPGALLSLPVGAALYAAVLGGARDPVFVQLVDAARDWLRPSRRRIAQRWP